MAVRPVYTYVYKDPEGRGGREERTPDIKTHCSTSVMKKTEKKLLVCSGSTKC